MQCVSSLTPKGTFLFRHSWRLFVAAGLWLLLFLSPCVANNGVSPRAYAAVSITSLNGFTNSPIQGPAGTVVTVAGSGLTNGIKVQLGYTPNFSSCFVVSDSQVGSVTNGTFTGWFRWPTNMKPATIGVCVVINGSQSFVIGSFNLLSSTPPQVFVSPAIPSAGRQITVTGANFLPPDTLVNLLWQSANGDDSISLGSVSSNSKGAFTQAFTIPLRSISGSYLIAASSGSGQPPVLSATATFHVNGVTLASVATPVKHISPTPLPTSVPTVIAPATAVPAPVQTGGVPSNGVGNDSSLGAKGFSHLLLAIALGGLLLIVIALLAGILIVRKQRGLLAASPSSAWYRLPGMNTNRTLVARPISQMANISPSTQQGGVLPAQYRPVYPDAEPDKSFIPFDPSLVEAMHEAQVSLFVMPKPPIGEALLSDPKRSVLLSTREQER